MTCGSMIGTSTANRQAREPLKEFMVLPQWIESGRNTIPIGEEFPRWVERQHAVYLEVASSSIERRLSGCVTALGIARKQKALFLPLTANVMQVEYRIAGTWGQE